MFKSLRWDESGLYILDQTKLPLEVSEEKQESVEQIWDSIKRLKVRGAPAIGVAGAYGVLLGLEKKVTVSQSDFLRILEKQANYLETARPTAVNLSWALKRMVHYAKKGNTHTTKALYEALVAEAKRIHKEDIELCKNIGLHGKDLIQNGNGILTHCNAGALATSELGTATAPMYLAHEEGTHFRVFADETRPLLQGARLTTWELHQAGIEVTLITDSMAASMMEGGDINMVIVGTDRVAANGDVANKIGTLGLAILANYFQIPFYVACPMSTVDLHTKTGEEIVIEERSEEEVTHFGSKRVAAEGVNVRNPAFDVTPNKLVTGIITEQGIIRPPYEVRLDELYH